MVWRDDSSRVGARGSGGTGHLARAMCDVTWVAQGLDGGVRTSTGCALNPLIDAPPGIDLGLVRRRRAGHGRRTGAAGADARRSRVVLLDHR